MADSVQKGDFIEINYTGKLSDGTVFDTTVKEVAEQNKIHSHGHLHPAEICVGEKQLLPGLDAAIPNKEIGKQYSITLAPEEAFGKRDVKKMKIVPSSTFKEHKVQPQPGLQIDVDGERGTVTRVSGGRVIVNFNHPLAGKEVMYNYTIEKKITDPKDKILAFVHTTMKVPKDKTTIEIKEEKATVEIPMQLPPQFTEAIGKHLAELINLKEVEFKLAQGNTLSNIQGKKEA